MTVGVDDTRFHSLCFAGVIPPSIIYGFKRFEAKLPGQMGLHSSLESSSMRFRARELSGSPLQTLSRNTPYRDVIRGEFRRQTSRGHNEDLITLDVRYSIRIPASTWQELLGSSNVYLTFYLGTSLGRDKDPKPSVKEN